MAAVGTKSHERNRRWRQLGRRVARAGILVALVASSLTLIDNSRAQATTTSPGRLLAAANDGDTLRGYWMLDAAGNVYGFGDAEEFTRSTTSNPVAIVPSPTGGGYWIISANGAVTTRGDRIGIGSGVGRVPAGQRVTSASATPGGDGLWLFTDAGAVITVGDAQFYGDLSDLTLDGPVVASAATPTGRGYLMAAEDGGVFTFGDAVFRGSVPGVLPPGVGVDKPVVGITPTPSNGGYWLVAADGGIFAFGDAPFRGSIPGVLPIGTSLAKPVNGMVPYGSGYLMVADDGGIFSFSDLEFLGSLGANPPSERIVGVAPVPTRTRVLTIPSGGAIVDLTIPTIPGAKLWASSAVFARSTDLSVWTTPGPSTVPELLAENPLFAASMIEASDLLGGDSMFAPFIARDGSMPGVRIHFGPRAGVVLREPLSVHIPLASLGMTRSDTALVLLTDGDGTEAAPSRIVGDELWIDVAHFSFLDIITKGSGKLGQIAGNIWNNPLASVPTGYAEALDVIDAGPLEAGLRGVFTSVCGREDIFFDDSIEPKLWSLLDSLGIAHQVGAGGGFKGRLAETTALKNLVVDRYDPQTRGPINNNPVMLDELFDWALDLMDGDIYQAIALSHDMLSLNQRFAAVQQTVQQVWPGGDNVGGRYHLFGSAAYSFMYEQAKRSGNAGFFDVPPAIAVRLEEAWVSGDIRSETGEYVLDRKGIELGRQLFDLWIARSGRADADQRDFFAATCGHQPPPRLRVELIGPVQNPAVNAETTLRLDVSGGYEPNDGTGDRSYVVTIREPFADDDLTLLVPYLDGNVSSIEFRRTFTSSGAHVLRAVASDSVGSTSTDSSLVRVDEPVDPCPGCAAGDYALVVHVHTRERLSGFCRAELASKSYDRVAFSEVKALSSSDVAALQAGPPSGATVGAWFRAVFDHVKYTEWTVRVVASNISPGAAANLRTTYRAEHPEEQFGRQTSDAGRVACTTVLGQAG